MSKKSDHGGKRRVVPPGNVWYCLCSADCPVRGQFRGFSTPTGCFLHQRQEHPEVLTTLRHTPTTVTTPITEEELYISSHSAFMKASSVQGTTATTAELGQVSHSANRSDRCVSWNSCIRAESLPVLPCWRKQPVKSGWLGWAAMICCITCPDICNFCDNDV